MNKRDLEIRFTQNTKDAQAGIDRMSGKVRGLSQLMNEAFRFEDQARKALSIADLTREGLAELSRDVDALAKAAEQDPQVLAQGLYDIYEDGDER